MSPVLKSRRLPKAAVKLLIGSIIIVVTATALLFENSTDRTSQASAATPCQQVQIVGLRGSSEGRVGSEHDMGSLLGPVADEIKNQIAGAASVGMHGLPYPASGATYELLTREYFSSKDQGVNMLRTYLETVSRACPTTKFVVMGYSQGAHAAGDYLARAPRSITDHVSSLVMFGDPRFNPNTSYVRGTFRPGDHGVAGTRSSGDFSGWAGRVMSFCNADDPICQGADKLFFHGLSWHKQAVYFGNYGHIAGALVRRNLSLPRPPDSRTPLDLAFVIDSTGSMGSSIHQVAASANQMADNLRASGADYRIGLVDFKDVNQGDPYAARIDVPMTTNITIFKNAVSALVADGGGDTPEAVYSGMMKAINGLKWRPVPRKNIILMGDAPAKNPEPVTGYTETRVLNGARNLDPATIFPVTVGSAPVDSFTPLAEGSGGEVFESESGDVSDEILDAVDEAAVPLYSSLTVTSPARPGAVVYFSAAGSYYDLGEIDSYEWDFDGDGSADETTAGPQTKHIYPSTFSGIASVKVLTDDGNDRTTTASIEISENAPVPPGEPSGVTAQAGTDNASIDIKWDPPTDSGGADISGYLVDVQAAATQELVIGSIEEPSVRKKILTGLAPGSYNVSVSSANEAGSGPTATKTVELVVKRPDEPVIVDPPPPPPKTDSAECLAARAAVVTATKSLSSATKAKAKLLKKTPKSKLARKKLKANLKKAKAKVSKAKAKLKASKAQVSANC